MNLTTENMARFVGGQLEIVGTGADEYRYRGQINKIEVVPDDVSIPGGGQPATLHIEFDYICEMKPNIGFVPSENKPYDISLVICGVSDIGMNRIALNSSIVNEMSVFYPPNHNKRVLADGSVQRDEE